MSYLQRPRLHFFGNFETDVSTVNNLATNFDEGTFTPEDAERTRDGSRGSWNPTGTGMFRVLDCGVTAAHYRDGTDARDDAVLGMQLVDAGDRVPGKLVDLDPDQQMVSQIWGLRLRLMTPSGSVAVGGRFAVTPFTDIWPRQQGGGGSGAMSAFYQSELLDVEWSDLAATSRFLRELRGAGGDGPLSIRFVVDAFNGNYTKPETFRMGRLAGSLGVARVGEPRHFVRGRQLFSAQMSAPGFPFGPPASFGNAVAVVDREAGKVVADFGNALPTGPAPSFEHEDVGTLQLGTGTAAAFVPLGEIPYRAERWYERTAGVVELPAAGQLTPAQLDALESTPLAVLGTGAAAGVPALLASEAPDGSHVRADEFVFRVSPGDELRIPLYATAFGRPLAGAQIACDFDNSQFGSDDGTPTSALRPAGGSGALPTTLTTNRDGIAWLTLLAGNPGNPRVYLDGQVYGIRPVLARTLADKGLVNPSDFLSLLLFDEVLVPDQPTWWTHVHPILQQYANLYPVMKQVLDLGDYQSVVAHKEMLRLVFSLPVEDPNYMPVTRDLSPKKRELLLEWLSVSAGEPLLGNPPPLGSVPAPAPVPAAAFALAAPVAAAEALVAEDAEEPVADGKEEFLRRTPRYGKELETP